MSQSGLGGSTYFGFEAGLNDDLVTRRNTGIGYWALLNNINGHSNTAVGDGALLLNATGYQNIAVGRQSLYSNIGGYQNIAIGGATLLSNINGHSNIAVGCEALQSNTTGLRNIGIGFMAGRYELGNDAFYVNNQDRIDTANEKLTSIIYGQMAALVANQKLTFNADVKITGKTGLNGVAPVGQAAYIPRPINIATAIMAINAILVALEDIGAVANAP